MDINPENETSFTTQYQVALLKYVKNEYCDKHRRLPVIEPDRVPSNNLFPSAIASGYGQSCFDPFDLFSDDEEYITIKNVAAMRPGQSNCAAHLLTAASIDLNSSAESPMNRG